MNKAIEEIIQQQHCMKSDDDIKNLVSKYYNDIINEEYDFSKFKKEKFTQQGKKRNIYTFESESVENVITRYLKIKMDKLFDIKYISRNKIINTLFNTLPVVNDLNDFVIIRADFKSFFESVPTNYVYEKYIKESKLKRCDKRKLKEYAENFEYCYAGLCLSNGLTEIVCRDFDKKLRSELDKYGVIYCERYVDDILILINSYISKDDVIDLIEKSIIGIFEDSPVKLNPQKFSYIARRYISETQEFDFLGYKFSVLNKNQGKRNCIKFKFGITDAKISKYSNRFEQIFIEYNKNGDLELLRQRLKICSTRTIITKQVSREKIKWMTKGVVANYNELRFHMDSLDESTEIFFKNIYFDIMEQMRIKTPYFLVKSNCENSIYNIYSSLERNRSTIFENRIGIKKKDLVKWITKIDSEYVNGYKNYSLIISDYFDKINIK